MAVYGLELPLRSPRVVAHRLVFLLTVDVDVDGDDADADADTNVCWNQPNKCVDLITAAITQCQQDSAYSCILDFEAGTYDLIFEDYQPYTYLNAGGVSRLSLVGVSSSLPAIYHQYSKVNLTAVASSTTTTTTTRTIGRWTDSHQNTRTSWWLPLVQRRRSLHLGTRLRHGETTIHLRSARLYRQFRILLVCSNVL